jgi:alkylation response protein AidB-like acyl-CoA dehydrogenase
MLTDSQPTFLRELASVTRAVARDKIGPLVEETEESGTFSPRIRERLAEAGLLGLVVPERFGGVDSDVRAEMIVLDEISRVYPSAATYLTAHWVSSKLLVAAAQDGQQDRWLATALQAAATGERLGAIAATEPGAGSDLAAIRTRAERDGDSWILHGSKRFITNGGFADFYVVLARTSDEGARGISLFYVDAARPGVLATRHEKKMGLHGSATAEMQFDAVRIPASHLVGPEGKGFPMLMRCFDAGRVGVAAISLGIAEAALAHSLSYVREREQFGKAIAQFQGVQFMVADMAIQVSAARALVSDAAEAVVLGRADAARLASMAKTFASEIAERVTSDAIQVHGGYGYTRDFPVEMLHRDNKVNQIYEGTNQIQRMIIARSLLGTL